MNRIFNLYVTTKASRMGSWPLDSIESAIITNDGLMAAYPKFSLLGSMLVDGDCFCSPIGNARRRGKKHWNKHVWSEVLLVREQFLMYEGKVVALTLPLYCILSAVQEDRAR